MHEATASRPLEFSVNAHGQTRSKTSRLVFLLAPAVSRRRRGLRRHGSAVSVRRRNRARRSRCEHADSDAYSDSGAWADPVTFAFAKSNTIPDAYPYPYP